MNNSVGTHLANQREHCATIPDVYFVMNKARVALSEALGSNGVSRRAKKLSTHVVVQAVNYPASTTKKCDHFRADQTRRSRNQQRSRFHDFSERLQFKDVREGKQRRNSYPHSCLHLVPIQSSLTAQGRISIVKRLKLTVKTKKGINFSSQRQERSVRSTGVMSRFTRLHPR